MSDETVTDEMSDDAFARDLQRKHDELLSRIDGDEIDSRVDPESSQRIQMAVPVLELLDDVRTQRVTEPERRFAETLEENSTFGRFRILRQVGRGGYGVVFRAHDPKLGRDVALKLPRIDTATSESSRIRFRREASAAAGLNHPAIVTVYESGTIHGIDYIVTEFIQGESLAERLAEHQRPSQKQSACLIQRMAEAIAHAHERGVLHRDIKPGNVLVPAGDFDSAKLADFGLALQSDSNQQTASGTILGTPAYMSPEQAIGDRNRIGPTSDIYSLGAVLYELLTGCQPFEGRTIIETIRMICEDEPMPPRRLQASLSKDLDAICLKCLEKDPRNRYTSAESLAEDLRRHLRGDSVHARLPAPWVVAGRFSRRYPLALLLIAILAALAIVGPTVALRQAQLYREAQEARHLAERTLYTSDINLAMNDWEDANVERCGELLLRNRPDEGQPDYRGFEWFYLYRLWHRNSTTPIIARDDKLESFAVSPDGSILAVGRYDGRLSLIDRNSGNLLWRTKAHDGKLFAIRFSSDGRQLATANMNNQLRLWNVDSGDRIDQANGGLAMEFFPSGDKIAFRGSEQQLTVRDLRHKTDHVIDSALRVHCIAVSPSGRRIATAGFDHRVRVIDAETGAIIYEFDGHGVPIWRIDYSRDGKWIASGDVQGNLKIWNAVNGSLAHSVKAHDNAIYSMAFSRDSTRVATGGTDSRVKVFPIHNPDYPAILTGHFGEIVALAFADNDDRLMSASIDGTVRLWDLHTDNRIEILDHPGGSYSVDFSPDGQTLVSACQDGNVYFWDPSRGTLKGKLRVDPSLCFVARFVYLQNDLCMVTKGSDDRLRFWSLQDHREIHSLPCRPNDSDPFPLAVSRDRRCLAYPDADQQTVVWDLDDNMELWRHDLGTVNVLALTDDHHRLAAAVGGNVIVARNGSVDPIATLIADQRQVWSLSFSPGSHELAVGGYDRNIKWWTTYTSDVETSNEYDRRTRGISAIITSVAYSDDGELFASGGEDRTVRIWDSMTGEQRAVLKGHEGAINGLAVSPDGQVIASACTDYTVRLWHAPRDADRHER